MMTTKKIAFLTVSVALMITLLAGAVFGQGTPKTNVYKHLSIFSEVLDLVRSNYVEPVGSEKLLDGAFNGVTEAIDEFSYYVPPAQMPTYRQFQDVEDNGIGLIVTKRYGYAYVIAVVEGSPAEKAGIERGDFIEKIDGQSVQNMPVWQVRGALRRDRPVKLQVLSGGETERSQKTVEPDVYRPARVRSEMMDGIAYIRIPYFEEGTAAEFRAALDDVRGRGARKLIVDLRGNAAGSVEQAIASADALLTSGLITSLQGRRVASRQWQADRETSFDGEVQVLVDRSTASGAEIFASAIRGNERGKVVGVSTYGKTITQHFVALPSGGGVHMTIGRYTAPDLKVIDAAGVKPDVVVDLSAQAIEDPEGEQTPEEDLILEKALQLFGVERPARAAAELKPAA